MPTYEQLGATLSGALPPGYVHDDESVLLEHGDDPFSAGRAALVAWAAHRGSGIVVSEDAEVTEGRTVALAAPLPVGVALAVCRIIRVVDEPDRFGFAYGTLPLHPEEGEEAFLIERDPGGQVRFRIVAFSKPRFWAARLARPAARVLQLRALRNYLRAMQRAVSAQDGRGRSDQHLGLVHRYVETGCRCRRHDGRLRCVERPHELRWWERTLLVIFGLFLVGGDVSPFWLRVATTVVGWSIALSAVGSVELIMALYYRLRSTLRTQAHRQVRHPH